MEEANSFLEPASTRVRDPLSGRSVWLAGMVKDARIESESLKYTLEFKPGHSPQDRQGIQAAIQVNLEGLGWSGEVVCNARLLKGGPTNPAEPVRGMASRGGVQPHGGPIEKKDIEGVTHIVAVASGKGGVGKSTIATNLAIGLSKTGLRVGLMDADIYGPSVPTMMNVHGRPLANKEKKIIPLEAYGIPCMSMGFLVPDKEAVIWRGPMVTQALEQLLNDTRWKELDYLVIDLPPGTGDTQLTLAQKVPVSGAAIVTTPQDIALLDARKALKMFEKVEIPVLGVIENMSTHVCSSCGHEEAIFGEGGGEQMAEEYGVETLGRIPLDIRIREDADSGRPTVVADPDGAITMNYRSIARHVAGQLAARRRSYSDVFPSIVIQNT